jgi:hypothetical protein
MVEALGFGRALGQPGLARNGLDGSGLPRVGVDQPEMPTVETRWAYPKRQEKPRCTMPVQAVPRCAGLNCDRLG